MAQSGRGPGGRASAWLAPVAQLDRAGGFYPSGSGFDSWRGRSARRTALAIEGGSTAGRWEDGLACSDRIQPHESPAEVDPDEPGHRHPRTTPHAGQMAVGRRCRPAGRRLHRGGDRSGRRRRVRRLGVESTTRGDQPLELQRDLVHGPLARRRAAHRPLVPGAGRPRRPSSRGRRRPARATCTPFTWPTGHRSGRMADHQRQRTHRFDTVGHPVGQQSVDRPRRIGERRRPDHRRLPGLRPVRAGRNGSPRWSIRPPTGSGGGSAGRDQRRGPSRAGADAVAGSLGQVSYALDAATGAPLTGWPFFNSDSTHSTAALADLYGTGQNEIIVGGDQTAGEGTGPDLHQRGPPPDPDRPGRTDLPGRHQPGGGLVPGGGRLPRAVAPPGSWWGRDRSSPAPRTPTP